MSPNNGNCLISNILCSRHWLQGSARDKLEHSMYPEWGQCWRQTFHTSPSVHMDICGLGFATIQEQQQQELQYNEQLTFWHKWNRVWGKNKYDILGFFFFPPRPIIYLILFKDLFLTGLRFRNRNSQRGQPTLLAICSWHFLLASLHSLGQMFSIFCGLLISLSYCLFRAVLQDAWSDMKLSLGWPGPWFPTFFKGFLTTHWHTSF